MQQTFERLISDLSRLQRRSSALTQAVYEGRINVVRKLLANGADPNHFQPSTGPWAPAHWARWHSRTNFNRSFSRSCGGSSAFGSGGQSIVRRGSFGIGDPSSIPSGQYAAISNELLYHNADFDIGTRFPRVRVPRGVSANRLVESWSGSWSPSAQEPHKPDNFRLWGLWVTLDARTVAGKWVDLNRSPVSRLRYMMMNHYSLDMWQVPCCLVLACAVCRVRGPSTAQHRA